MEHPHDNRILDLFGIELPIIQAPMAGATTPEMVIAASEAGGLGSLPGALLSTDQMTQAIDVSTRRTPREQVRQSRAVVAPLSQSVAMKRRDPGFGRQEVGRADLNGRRAQCEGGSHSTPVGNPSGRDHRHVDGVGDLRNESEGADLGGHVAPQEIAAVATRLKPHGDDRIDAVLGKPAGLLDRVADEIVFAPVLLTRSNSSGRGNPKWKLTTSGRYSSTIAQ